MNSRSGNAIVIILIAVFLFGALAAAFMRGAKTGQGNLTVHQAKLLANDIINYAQALERGTAKLMQRSCSESQLEYDTGMTDCGANTDSPPDNSCDLFNTAGAGMNPLTFSSLPSTAVVRVSGGSSLEDIGTWDPNSPYDHQDIVFWIGPVDLNTCNALNKMVGIDGPPIDFDISGQNWCFNDDLGSGHFGGSIMELDTNAGKKAACINNTGTPMNDLHVQRGYQFYYVIFER